MSERIFVFGASGHAKVVIDAARHAGWEVVAGFDDDPALHGRRLLDCPIIGGRDMLRAWCDAESVHIGVVAVGNNRLRQSIAAWLIDNDIVLAAIVHPCATLGAGVTVGPGTVIMAGAVINPDTRVGTNCIVNTGASIDHDCVVGDAAHVAPGCSVCGGVRIGDGVLLGAGSVVVPGIEIGEWASIGAGSTVVGNIRAGVDAFGTPCRER